MGEAEIGRGVAGASGDELLERCARAARIAAPQRVESGLRERAGVER